MHHPIKKRILCGVNGLTYMHNCSLTVLGLFFSVARVIKSELQDVSCHYPLDKWILRGVNALWHTRITAHKPFVDNGNNETIYLSACIDGLEYFSVKRNDLSRNRHSQLSTSRALNQCNCDSRINSHPSKVSIFAPLSGTKRLSLVGVKTMHLSLKFYGSK